MNETLSKAKSISSNLLPSYQSLLLFSSDRNLLLIHQIRITPQTLNHQLMTLRPPINIPNIIRRSLKVAGRIIRLRDKDVVVQSTLKWLVQWNRWAHELLLDLSETLETRGELEVVICRGLGHGGDDGDVVAWWADVVGGGNHRNVDVCKS